MGNELLQVGDTLYSYHRYGKGINKHTVKRVTATQAILDNGTSKVRREIRSWDNGKYCNEIGGYCTYYLENDDIKEKYEWWVANRQAHDGLQKIDIYKMSKEQLNNLTHFLSTIQTKETTT